MIKLALGSLLALAFVGSASAAVTFTSSAFDSAPAAGQAIVENFDDPIAKGFAFSGGSIERGSIAGFAAAPANDTTEYNAVMKGEIALLSSSKALSSASVYLGSVDSYNYIGFFDDGNYVGGFSGSQLVDDADGNQTSGLMNRRFNFVFGDKAVDQIGFGSTGYSFEFDNIAVSAVPEPSSWLLMIVGVGCIGLMRRQAKSIGQFDSRNALPA